MHHLTVVISGLWCYQLLLEAVFRIVYDGPCFKIRQRKLQHSEKEKMERRNSLALFYYPDLLLVPWKLT